MGFESFRVELQGGKGNAGEIDSVLPHIRLDHDSIAMKHSTYYVMDDGKHAIELELMDYAPVRLSCRFTLCHAATVEVAFLNLLQELMLRLGMEVRICEDVQPAHERYFSLTEFPDFAAIARTCIAARRAEWIAAFGNQPLAATTSEVFEQIILPRCQPGIEQPT